MKLFSSTPWTVACQLLLSTAFPRQAYWSALSLPSRGDLPNPGIEHPAPALAGGFYTTREGQANHALRRVCVCVLAKLLQSCPLCESLYGPRPSVHGILEARTLEWVAMPSSRGASRPRAMPHHKITLIPLQTGYQLKKSHPLAIIKFTATNYTKLDVHEQCSVDKK